jgi:hypothetical protein
MWFNLSAIFKNLSKLFINKTESAFSVSYPSLKNNEL